MLKTLEPIAVPAPLIMGLDTDQVPARLILATANGDPSPHPLQYRRFETLDQFRAYWASEWAGVPDIRVAAPRASKDPLGILRWLQFAEVPVERYRWRGYTAHLNGDFSVWDLPPIYTRAYVLALYASYRSQAAQVVRGMWARLLEMRELFDVVQTDLDRLKAALPDHVPPQLGDDCPF